MLSFGNGKSATTWMRCHLFTCFIWVESRISSLLGCPVIFYARKGKMIPWYPMWLSDSHSWASSKLLRRYRVVTNCFAKRIVASVDLCQNQEAFLCWKRVWNSWMLYTTCKSMIEVRSFKWQDLTCKPQATPRDGVHCYILLLTCCFQECSSAPWANCKRPSMKKWIAKTSEKTSWELLRPRSNWHWLVMVCQSAG